MLYVSRKLRKGGCHQGFSKVNSVQEACDKCFDGLNIKIWNLAIHMKKMKQRTSDPYFSLIDFDVFLFCFSCGLHHLTFS